MKHISAHIPSRKAKGFSLIEILVVIAIMATLAGLSYSPILSMINNSRRSEALNTMKKLERSINQFYIDYEHIPSNKRINPPSWDSQIWTNRGDGTMLLRVLMADESLMNTKGIEYFEAPESKNNKGGVLWINDQPTYLYDKFGNGFGILIDNDYDEILSIPKIYDPTGYGEIKGHKVLIWNAGPDKKMGTEDDLKSWDH